MLQVFYSNHTEKLFSAFADDVREWRKEVGPFKPLTVVVPNTNVEAWLKYGLARNLGIFANVRVVLLMTLVRELANEQGREVVTADLIRAALLSWFSSDAFWDDEEMRPLHRYLRGGDGGAETAGGEKKALGSAALADEALELRRFQLASQLAGIFAEYTLSRNSELLEPWLERYVLQDSSQAKTEAWQRALWLRLWGKNGLLSERHLQRSGGLAGESLGNAGSAASNSTVGDAGASGFRSSDSRASDSRLSDSRGSDSRSSDSRVGESRSSDSRATKSTAGDSTADELQGADSGARLPLILPAQLAKYVDEGQGGALGRVHVFGVSYVAQTFHQLFHSLAKKSELFIYTLNPCQEFWEDVENTRPELLPSYAASRSEEEVEEDRFFLDNPKDNPALRLWGRPGRENIHLLNELSGSDFQSDFVDPLSENSSLLRHLQRDILIREEQRDPVREQNQAPAKLDGSIRLLECYGVKREAEAIAGEIWRLVKESSEKDPEESRLRFNDIAVVVNPAEKEDYFTHLLAAFKEHHELPYNLVDRSFAAGSRIAEAASLLIGLPEGKFTRPEILNLLSHPSVGGELVFGQTEVENLVDWCDRLGIFHGGDKSDHEGTYIEGDRFNWDQGLRRMALGHFVTGSDEGDTEPLKLPEGEYLPAKGPTSFENAARFAALVRSLIGDARFARSARLTLSEWSLYFLKMLSAYLSFDKDDENTRDDDERALRECRFAMAQLAHFDFDGTRFGYRVAAELARELIEGIAGGSGQYLANGVVLSTCQPMRALPFKVVFMAGMGENKFPVADRRDPLDLRFAKRLPGDVYPNHRDRYLFLETLLCAREKIYFSWIARDATTGDPVEPSILVSELEAILRGYLSEEEHRNLRTALPLRRYDRRAFPELFGVVGSSAGSSFSENGVGARAESGASAKPTAESKGGSNAESNLEPSASLHPSLPDLPSSNLHSPELSTLAYPKQEPPILKLPIPPPKARSEAIALALRKRLEEKGLQGSAPAWSQLRSKLEPGRRERLERLMGFPQLEGAFDGADEALPEVIELSISNLVAFLRCPLQGWAKARLRLDSDGDDAEAAVLDGEPFVSPNLTRRSFLSQVFIEALRAKQLSEDALAAHYDRLNHTRKLESIAPEGLFGASERAKHLALLQDWATLWSSPETFERWGGARPLSLAVGRAPEFGDLDRVEPILELNDVPLVHEGQIETRNIRLHGRLKTLFESQAERATLILCDRLRDTRSVWTDWLQPAVEHAVLSALGMGEQAHHLLCLSAEKGKTKSLSGVLTPFSEADARQWLSSLSAALLSYPHTYFFPGDAVFQNHFASSRAKPQKLVDELQAMKEQADPMFYTARGPLRNWREMPVPQEKVLDELLSERFEPILSRFQGAGK